MEESMAYDIADIHEDILRVLLDFRKGEKEDFCFFLRSGEFSEALSKGWWFPGNERFLNIIFTEGSEGFRHRGNFQLTVNRTGHWWAEIEMHKNINDDFYNFASKFITNFQSLGESRVGAKAPLGNAVFQLKPYNPNYRESLLEAVAIMSKVFRQESFNDQNWLKKIDPESFLRSLDVINELRKPKSLVSFAGIAVKNFHGIKNAQVDNLPEKPSWIFLTGENGFGKTSLLQAIAIGLYGDTEDPIIPKNSDVSIEVAYRHSNTVRNCLQVNNIRHSRFFRPMDTLACYGPSRLQMQSQQSRNEEAKNATATYSLFNPDGILKNIEYELFASFYDNEKKFAMIEKLLTGVVPSLRKIELEKKERRILYFEKDEHADEAGFDPVGFDELASGIRGIIAMVGDIYIRLSDKMERRKIEKKSDADYYHPEELGGIVVIDELDLHLHPKWQKKLPTLLSGVFPNVQFIASTHSPIPLLGAPRGSVFVKVNRTSDEGITIEKLDVEIGDLTPNLILTSKIFGFADIFPITHDPKERIRTEDTLEEAELADKVMEELKSYLGTDKEKELARLLKSK